MAETTLTFWMLLRMRGLSSTMRDKDPQNGFKKEGTVNYMLFESKNTNDTSKLKI